MVERLAELIEVRFRISQPQATRWLQRSLAALGVASFVSLATVIVAFDSLFLANITVFEVGEVTQVNVIAPVSRTYESAVLTENAREEARNAVQPLFAPPDAAVFRQQTQLAQQILEYIDNVRADPYGSDEARLADLSAINAISLEAEVAANILGLSDESWDAIKTEIPAVLARVMQQEIQPDNLQRARDLVSIRVSPGVNPSDSSIIEAVTEDLIQPNTFVDDELTAAERASAAEAVEEQTRTLSAGQIIVRAGEPIEALDFEALGEFGLLRGDDTRGLDSMRAFFAVVLATVFIGLYIMRFSPQLITGSSSLLILLALLFLVMLAATRIPVIRSEFYIFPTGALGLLCVAIAGPHVGVVAMLGLALLAAIMASDSLLVATYIATGGIVGCLLLRRSERLNSFFVTGAVIGLFNAFVVIVFNITVDVDNRATFITQLVYAFTNGLLLTPATTLAVMYLVTMVFNLPTALKLIDLSQPSKPLLQRLLREAPGTYQHSLQVANLAEQAANAIGADAQLTHVAALYHDIGKMNNPLFFTENQQNLGNPHDTINDPYRSADIIISHATEGDELARQYRLPGRLRDFIREHHGTTTVYVFYQRALNAAHSDEATVDISDFSYPGPRPRSKETAILMLADSCEAAVRSIKPENKEAIVTLVSKIIGDKRQTGQLDNSGLTLNDLRAIQDIFVDILQSMFHPRINYKEAVAKRKNPAPTPNLSIAPPIVEPAAPRPEDTKPIKPITPQDLSTVQAGSTAKLEPEMLRTKALSSVSSEIEDEEPLTEVPRLKPRDDRRSTMTTRIVETDEPNADDPDESGDT